MIDSVKQSHLDNEDEQVGQLYGNNYNAGLKHLTSLPVLHWEEKQR